MTNKKHALGRGLAALLRDNEEVYKEEDSNLNTDKKNMGIHEISLERIFPNEGQPRKTINENLLKELAISIKEYGVLQPIIVHKKNDDNYEIIAGERRWRASHLAGLKTIPVIEHTLNTLDQMKISLVENIQRVELSALEEAMAYENLIELYDFTQENLAVTLGKSRSYLANILRLNKLSPGIKKALNEKKISYGHARCLIGFDERKALVYLEKILENNLNVRETEQLFKNSPKKKRKLKNKEKNEKADDIKSLEEDLSRKLGASVNILFGDSEKKIVIYVDDLNHFDSILDKII